MAYSLRARVVFPVDRPAIEHGFVTIDDERIVAVGTQAKAAEVIDLGSVALLPGLVNAHTHLEFSYLRRPLGEPGMRLVDWIRLVIAERGRGDYAPAAAIAQGLQASLEQGVTELGDISHIEFSTYSSSLIELTQFAEIIGFSQARADSTFGALVGWLLTTDAMRATGALPESLRLGISPHAPYTISPGLLRRLVGVAQDRKMPVAMHLAESAEELELLAEGSGPFQELLEERSMWDAEAIPHGSRPLDYLRMLAEAPRALVIHGNYLDAEERAFLAAKADRMSLVYCPRTHAYFGHPPYPLMELIQSGVKIALGTDSRASNPDLDLLEEMRVVARRYPRMDSHTVLRMGTLAGAEALGRATQEGSLTSGKLANLVVITLPDDAQGKPDELLNAILDGSDLPRAVWIRGAKVFGASRLG